MAELGLMAWEDLTYIAEMEKLCFATPWPLSAFVYELANESARYTVIRENGRTVGYAGYRFCLDEAEITNVAVHPDYRRRGYGRRIMQALIADAVRHGIVSLTLEVRAGNLPAQQLYSSLGFVKCGIRKGYYPDNGEDAWIMLLQM